MISVYGLKNCDRCRKTLNWLLSQNIENNFFDLNEFQLKKDIIKNWINCHGPEKLVNKKSKTWREIKNELSDNFEVETIEIIIKFPKILKRPLWELNGKPDDSLPPGFEKAHQEFLLG
jgi:arsenate reductase|tara:strand:+ start:22768 stop:23121 length:354 start_codon:yes stop_codon:yes gene_type:complete